MFGLFLKSNNMTTVKDKIAPFAASSLERGYLFNHAISNLV